MANDSTKKVGQIAWLDLTVAPASEVRDFYEKVVGWTSEEVSMGDYSDYTLHPPGSQEAVAGVCHARGLNADLPPQWLIYTIVEDIEQSVSTCKELGGDILIDVRNLGDDKYCVIRDPAGAVMALYQTG